jgi:hypothetical protein
VTSQTEMMRAAAADPLVPLYLESDEPRVGDIVRVRPGTLWCRSLLPTNVDYVVKFIADERATTGDAQDIVYVIDRPGSPMTDPLDGPALGLDDLDY